MVQGFRLVKTLLTAYHIEYKTGEHVAQARVCTLAHLFDYECEPGDAGGRRECVCVRENILHVCMHACE